MTIRPFDVHIQGPKYSYLHLTYFTPPPSISVLRSPAASRHVQLLVFWSAYAVWFLCHVWLWCPEFSTSRKEKVDAVLTTTRIRFSEDPGEAEVIRSVHTWPPTANKVLLSINNINVLAALVCERLLSI